MMQTAHDHFMVLSPDGVVRSACIGADASSLDDATRSSGRVDPIAAGTVRYVIMLCGDGTYHLQRHDATLFDGEDTSGVLVTTLHRGRERRVSVSEATRDDVRKLRTALLTSQKVPPSVIETYLYVIRE